MGLLSRMRARGLRNELPSAVPGTSIYPGSGQWGSIPLPLPSTITVEGLPAASRARNMISNAVALMTPFQQWGPDGFISDTTAPILMRPNAVYGLFDFWKMAIDMTIMRGDFLAIKADFGSTGYPNQLVPVPAGFWLAYYDSAGYLVYSIGGQIYSRDEVFHVRANAEPNRPMGTGVVTRFRRSLGQALDQQNLAADTYRSGSVPAGIIHLARPELDVTQTDLVQGQWVANHSSGSRAPAVLPDTMTFEALQWTPEDMQFLQARQFTVGEIAHMFDLDPTDLGAALAGDSMTYSNITQRQVQRTVDSYAQYMRRVEEEMGDCLPGSNTARLVPENLQRTDMQTQSTVDETQIGTSMRSTDELRKRDGLKPLPKPKPVAPPAGVPGAAGSDGAPAPGVAGGENPLSGGGIAGPTPVPGTDMTETPIKVKA